MPDPKEIIDADVFTMNGEPICNIQELGLYCFIDNKFLKRHATGKYVFCDDCGKTQVQEGEIDDFASAVRVIWYVHGKLGETVQEVRKNLLSRKRKYVLVGENQRKLPLERFWSIVDLFAVEQNNARYGANVNA